MKTRCIFLLLFVSGLPLFAQAEIAPGALDNLSALLNKPSVVKPAKATALEKNWYTTDMDTHIFTDQVNFKQIVSVLIDIENYGTIFDGKTTKLRTNIVSRENNETIADITSITIAFIRFTIKYSASIKILENTGTTYVSEVRQLDSAANEQIRNYHSIYYAEEVTDNGKKYTYIRISSLSDTYIGIKLSNITSTIEKNSVSSNEDTLHMIIEAARKR